MIKILIVDDDDNICQLLNLYLLKEGYIAQISNNGINAINKLNEQTFDLILLDIMMPEMDGFETLSIIRRTSNIPVIMLSAKGEPIDKISALDCGADDYVTKPFEPQELILRIKAILRRAQGQQHAEPSVSNSKDLLVGNLFISISTYIVKIDGEIIDMPPKEIEVLYLLASNPNKVFKRDELLEKIWGNDYKGDSRTVDVHVKRIREKLDSNDNWNLLTVWGVGYKFEVI